MRSFSAGDLPSAVAVGDFTGDGIPDLAVANYGGFGDVSVLSGGGDGNFQLTQTVRTTDLAVPGSVLLGNGDVSKGAVLRHLLLLLLRRRGRVQRRW